MEATTTKNGNETLRFDPLNPSVTVIQRTQIPVPSLKQDITLIFCVFFEITRIVYDVLKVGMLLVWLQFACELTSECIPPFSCKNLVHFLISEHLQPHLMDCLQLVLFSSNVFY